MSADQFGLRIRVVDLDDEGGRLLGTMRVNGSSHHLCFIRLREPGVAFKEKWQVELDKVYDLSEDTDVQTVELPGRKGVWVCYMHPYQV